MDKILKIMMGSTDWAIVEALEASGELNRRDLRGAAKEILKEIGNNASDRAIDKRIDKLKEDEIFCIEKVGKYALYRLNPEGVWEYIGVELRTKKGKKDKQFIENAIAKYLSSKDHTDDLKKIIRQWLKELPIISIDGVHRVPPTVIIGGSELLFGGNCEKKLPIEIENDIFKDLLFHIEKQDNQIVGLWEKFKEMCVEHHNRGKVLISEIEKELAEQINGIIVREAGNGKLEISSAWKVNSISERFVNRIFHACTTCAEGNAKHFSEHYENFESFIKPMEDSLEYSIDGEGYVKIEKGLLEEKVFKNKIDNVMKIMIGKSKSDYYSKGKEIVNLTGELIGLKNDIKNHLKKQLLYVVFKGDCEYLMNNV